jgi:hypothetical protein
MAEDIEPLPIPEQTFFAEPTIDRLLAVVMTLAAEVQMLRDRVHHLEADRAGEAPTPSHDQTADYVSHILTPLLGEQQARGPL